MNTSFQRQTDRDGWRYSASHRTRRENGSWIVQRWNGRDWQHVGSAPNYAGARAIASK